MKEIKRTVTREEITGYEANDGTIFKTKEECEKYENTAEAVINKEFRKLMLGGEEFPECQIYENFGYGSEEFNMAVLDIKNANDLEIANRYYELHSKKLISNEYIGKRTLVCTGYSHDRNVYPCPKTYEELVEQFKRDTKKFFQTKEEREAEKNE